ncbi:MAG: SBBP repeat-containing protein [Acidobacteria bacterium]|nr:SBBP repeat-containing protein [Acidobacteriota bacterium]
MSSFEGASLRMELPSTKMEGQDRLSGASIYSFGSDPGASRLDVSRFGRVRYLSPFPGINLDVYWGGGEVEYDWIVEPGADPSLIHFSFSGAELVRLDNNGDLVIETPTGHARHRKPLIYQEVDGVRREVAGGFRLDTSGTVRFWMAGYDRRRPLVIDPQIVWATGFGGTIQADVGTLHPRISDFASGITVDRAGNTYVTGTAVSSQIPLIHPLQSVCESNHCVFVTKIAPDGKTVLYSTYLGTPASVFGFPLYDGKAPIPAAIAADPDGNVYLTGAAFRLPRSDGGMTQSAGINDVFVVKLDTNGVLKATLLIGGSGDDAGTSISLGPEGYLYIAGTTQSNDFPISPGAYRAPVSGPTRFFSLKIDPKALIGDTQFSHAVAYASVFGAYSQSYSNRDSRFSPPQIGADAQGNAYISVYTDCTGIDATPGALRTNCRPDPLSSVGVVVKMNPTGTKLLWVAMPTGSGRSYINGLAVTAQGFTYMAGTTQSADFPMTPGAFDTTLKTLSESRAFVAKLSPEGTGLAYATYLGDPGSISVLSGMVVDPAGNAYVAGETASTQFPTLNSMQSPLGNCCYGFVTAIKPDGSGLVWSTLLGASARADAVTLDAKGNVYAAGDGIDPSGSVSTFNYGSSITVVKVAPGGLPFPIDGITNAASFQPGLPFPGGLASMFVHDLDISGTVQAVGAPLPLDLAGVSIIVNGVPAPILSVSNLGIRGTNGSQQINFQVPFEVYVGRRASVELRYQGVSSFGMPVAAPPGIFAQPDGSGAIQHASDYNLVTPQNPAAPGEVIIVYVTGLGLVRPAVSTGSAATTPAPIVGYCYMLPTVNVGAVLYAGLTPGFPGLYQMNVRLSSNIPSGNAQVYITWTNCEQPNIRSPFLYVTSRSNSVVLPVR